MSIAFIYYKSKFFVKEMLIIGERKRPLTEYGIKVKIKLMQINKTQSWLIEEVKNLLPQKYVDSSNIYKILTGEIKSTEIKTAINQILGIERTDENE